MASNFLENLKKSVEEGDFNSEAARKINEIDKLADEKTQPFKDVTDRLDETGYAESVSKEEAAELNSEYEKQMALTKKQDTVNAQLATLIEIEDLVKASVVDMLEFTKELDENFSEEFKAEDPMFGDLALKMEQIRSKYKSIINN